ncbi:MAG: hypothetical protein IH946_07510 [Bacteroidetes bacterium]|nr:hypothetical protein [Bacteroidota bacterium]
MDPLEEMLVSDPQNQTVSSYIDGHDIGKTLGPDKDDPAMKYLYGGAAFCAGFCCWGPGVWGVVQASSHDKNLTELAVIGSVISYSLTVLFTIVTIYADTW